MNVNFLTHIALKLLKIKVATILNIDLNFFVLEDILVLKLQPSWILITNKRFFFSFKAHSTST